jgi:hypothetical protein
MESIGSSHQRIHPQRFYLPLGMLRCTGHDYFKSARRASSCLSCWVFSRYESVLPGGMIRDDEPMSMRRFAFGDK